MDLTFHLTNMTYWQKAHESDSLPQAAGDPIAVDKKGWPTLPWVPAMQRRRLSPFMKMALHCAYETSTAYNQPLATVFSSRHGDLTQTSSLLETLANNDPLSPTGFSLSVHNAVAGLFSILNASTTPSTTIAAGQDTLAMAIVDAIAKAQQQQAPILLVHADQAMPSRYADFEDERQISHALAFIIEPTLKANVRLTRIPSSTSQPTTVPFSVAFGQNISSAQQTVTQSQDWQWKYTP
ncbi:beta-ketoacyl synthase chain length factor [Alteromonas sp. C1M14]|uniref:beta-ketoacyl synthase chain length factor n=1 Tax=Alteromonas sp. C1M14 TaxID=2841567 RepID=UPI001C098759|nr:beta-ketoacyl synthase chain length factor [Alteromonas sp. C1M14]MBU2979653.1 beta-ketoacyl synthase chain length factor [Alteromonas sp. C1M14]